jgi:hypothetical protein
VLELHGFLVISRRLLQSAFFRAADLPTGSAAYLIFTARLSMLAGKQRSPSDAELTRVMQTEAS